MKHRYLILTVVVLGVVAAAVTTYYFRFPPAGLRVRVANKGQAPIQQVRVEVAGRACDFDSIGQGVTASKDLQLPRDLIGQMTTLSVSWRDEQGQQVQASGTREFRVLRENGEVLLEIQHNRLLSEKFTW